MSALRSKFLPGLMVLTILSFSAIAFVPAAVAAPATYVVNNTGDSSDMNQGDGICLDNQGNCTLKAAIEESNANSDLDTIEFNIPGSGVHRIAMGANSQFITNPVIINGYSQPGSVVNTAIAPLPLNNIINIEIDTSSDVNGLTFSDNANGSTLKGVAIFGSTDQLIRANVDDLTIVGNYIGTDATGLSDAHYPANRTITTGAGNDNLHIGGTAPADRNVIVSGKGVDIDGANARVFGNYFGIGKDGVTPLTGVSDVGASNLVLTPSSSNGIVGGPNAGEINVNASNNILMLAVQGSGHKVQGNFIGTDYLGQTHSNYGRGAGITLVGEANNNLIGGTNPGEGNIIAGTGGAGIGVLSLEIPLYSYFPKPAKNAILGNSISNVGVLDYLGFGNSNLGLDLLVGHYEGAPNGAPETFSGGGPSSNDDDENDADIGANGLINTPVLNSAIQTGNQLTVNYNLHAADSPTNQYRVEFFASDEATIFGSGPGQYFLGAVQSVNGDGNSVTITLPSSDSLYGKALSATTTAIDSTTDSDFGSTSEFAKNIQVGSATDFDSDGVADSVENTAANNGDGNDDGTADYLQSRVSSYTVGEFPVTFETSGSGCAANGSVVPEAASDADAGFAYPYGLTDFTLNCTVGGIAEITKYVFDDNGDAVTDYSVRKYRPGTHTYEAVPNATVERVTIGGETALKMQYEIVEGESLDDDGVANGIIVDPVGLAHVFTESQVIETPTTTTTTTPSGAAQSTKSATGTLSTTGANSNQLFNLSLSMLFAGLTVALIAKAKGRKAKV